MYKTKKIVTLGLFTALALVVYIVEAQIPVPVPIPAVKLGLANVISLLVLMIIGWKEALFVVIIRTILGSIFTGGFSAFLFSLCGALFSNIVMILLYQYARDYISVYIISIIGAIFHNAGQLLVASIIIQNMKIYLYAPVLLISGIITGFFVGLAAQFSYNHLKKFDTLLFLYKEK
ncbi:MAG: Gx transporter family protein [Epulopiscium sp.]|nr:Gx transporter family protein [Candidatus Epulonipiscium sp.]